MIGTAMATSTPIAHSHGIANPPRNAVRAPMAAVGAPPPAAGAAGERDQGDGGDCCAHRDDEDRDAGAHAAEDRDDRGDRGSQVAQGRAVERRSEEEQRGDDHGGDRREQSGGGVGGDAGRREDGRVPERPSLADRLLGTEDRREDQRSCAHPSDAGGGDPRGEDPLSTRLPPIERHRDDNRQHGADQRGVHRKVAVGDHLPAQRCGGGGRDGTRRCAQHDGGRQGFAGAARSEHQRVGDAEDDHRAGHRQLDEHRLEADDEHGRSAHQRGHADHGQSRALQHGVGAGSGGGERRRERVREAADRRAEESDRDGSARLERDEPGCQQTDAGRQGERRREVGAAELRDHRPQAADDAEGERRHAGVDGWIHRAGAEEVVRAHRPAVEPEQDDADRGDRLGRRPQREAPQHRRPDHRGERHPADDQGLDPDVREVPRVHEEEDRRDADERDADDEQQHRHREPTPALGSGRVFRGRRAGGWRGATISGSVATAAATAIGTRGGSGRPPQPAVAGSRRSTTRSWTSRRAPPRRQPPEPRRGAATGAATTTGSGGA